MWRHGLSTRSLVVFGVSIAVFFLVRIGGDPTGPVPAAPEASLEEIVSGSAIRWAGRPAPFS